MVNKVGLGNTKLNMDYKLDDAHQPSRMSNIWKAWANSSWEEKYLSLSSDLKRLQVLLMKTVRI